MILSEAKVAKVHIFMAKCEILKTVLQPREYIPGGQKDLYLVDILNDCKKLAVTVMRKGRKT